ncbi:unnamed protein product [Somion occarium]|uniref:Extracellular metalloproteinase n=1 Tax=Somion occarium TaxID=3059160 RepID=A0ABP1D6U5_9APHY
MRRLLVASLAAAGLAAALAHDTHSDSNQLRRRKTLGFGPAHPHATYRTAPLYTTDSFGAVREDPIEVARRFILDITKDIDAGSHFVIRKDSYTDKNTGITHVFARQFVEGVEIADGDINVNVKDGVILSYGDSFHRGPLGDPFSLTSERLDVHSEYCNQLAAEMQSRVHRIQHQLFGEQTPMRDVLDREQQGFETLFELREWNCAHVDTPYKMSVEGKFSASSEEAFAGQALLQFMIAATPNSGLAESMAQRPSDYLNKMTFSYVHDLTGESVTPAFIIDNVPDAVSPVKAKMVLVQVPSGHATTLEAVWRFEVEMQDNWYEAAVTVTEPHRIVSVVDWASDSPIPTEPSEPKTATYNVFAWGVNDPSVGNRSVQKENFDHLASPIGWHSLPTYNDPATTSSHSKVFRNTTDTWGNNVFAHENWEGRNAWVTNYRPDAGESLNFNFTYHPKETNRTDSMDEAKKYINTTITQLFYTGNMIHDLYYRYGFDEVSGNFQQHNFGRGGEEGDAVIMNAQDGSGFNNANFMTPPDGQNGRCRMYLWNTANPYRDGDLEAGIVIHEYSHGLSTRLTGGPANSGCLGWGESGGMGEGWGDFLATTVRSNKNYSDYAMGAWAANRETGIRNYVYSLNETVNPSTYKTLDKPGYWGVHAIGEVWAQILWVVSQRLIQKHGFIDSLYPPLPDADGTVPEGDFYRTQEYTSSGEKKPLVPKHGNSLIFQYTRYQWHEAPTLPTFVLRRS